MGEMIEFRKPISPSVNERGSQDIKDQNMLELTKKMAKPNDNKSNTNEIFIV